MKPTYEELEAIVKKLKIDADCYKKGMEASNARLVQLAAENAALKSKAAELVHEASEVYSAYNSSITEHDGDFMDMQTLQEMQCVETPATSVFLDEVRAQGADECVRQLVISDAADDFCDAPNVCAMVAHQLRKGDVLLLKFEFPVAKNLNDPRQQ
ncbi:hypothetical protein [Citrobacter amalonaticus]|uniref:hypothetical protein n=1 Tax=Citrobacter amalonaticus TaxID=35703 RepID=UPI00388E32D4|nr:hypothetical protein [Citrobacter amalonaticus]